MENGFFTRPLAKVTAIMPKVALLGSTGSIGRSTLDLHRQHPGLISLQVISAHHNIQVLLQQMEEFHPQRAFITGCHPTREDLERARRAGCELLDDPLELLKTMADPGVDCVVLAIIGAAGLEYGLKALRHGKRLAMANKEPLVIAGHLFKDAAAQYGGEIVPIDSEHSAIFQCLEGRTIVDIERIILTSSGGPFHEYANGQFAAASVAQALKHPTWSMGKKITIDSATMMNKALEVIEARWLFGVPMEKIAVTIHRQSIVHSMVEFVDGSMLAQLGETDMKHPIHFALTYPNRCKSQLARLDWTVPRQLTFEPLNPFLAQAIDLARQCTADPVSPVLLNAANEVFVEHFLAGSVAFTRVYDVIAKTMKRGLQQRMQSSTLEEVLEVDGLGRTWAKEILRGM